MPGVGAPEAAQLVSAIRLYCDEDSQNRALLKALRSRGVEVASTPLTPAKLLAALTVAKDARR